MRRAASVSTRKPEPVIDGVSGSELIVHAAADDVHVGAPEVCRVAAETESRNCNQRRRPDTVSPQIDIEIFELRSSMPREAPAVHPVLTPL
jgi:hypothetical protein